MIQRNVQEQRETGPSDPRNNSPKSMPIPSLPLHTVTTSGQPYKDGHKLLYNHSDIKVVRWYDEKQRIKSFHIFFFFILKTRLFLQFLTRLGKLGNRDWSWNGKDERWAREGGRNWGREREMERRSGSEKAKWLLTQALYDNWKTKLQPIASSCPGSLQSDKHDKHND